MRPNGLTASAKERKFRGGKSGAPLFARVAASRRVLPRYLNIRFSLKLNAIAAAAAARRSLEGNEIARVVAASNHPHVFLFSTAGEEEEEEETGNGESVATIPFLDLSVCLWPGIRLEDCQMVGINWNKWASRRHPWIVRFRGSFS